MIVACLWGLEGGKGSDRRYNVTLQGQKEKEWGWKEN